MLSIHQASLADLPAILDIQQANYPAAMQEDSAVIQSRLQAAPDTCWVACGHRGIVGYLFAYPSRTGRITPLGGPFSAHETADVLYLHDLAVARRFAGTGVGRSLLHAAFEAATRRRLSGLALVSVQGSRRYWESAGFAISAGLSSAQQAALASYPGESCYMVRRT